MSEIYETVKHRGCVIEICTGEDFAEDPRDWDNLGHMICFHKRYTLGDKTDLKSDDFGDWQELAAHIKKEYNPICILPLYLYDHSGITMSTGAFSCPWDSGQVGFIYCTKEDLKRMGTPKRRAEKVLRGEVETYDNYLTGEIYGYRVDEKGGGESCYGFYGSEGRKQAIVEAKSSINYHMREERKRKAKEKLNFSRVMAGLPVTV